MHGSPQECERPDGTHTGRTSQFQREHELLLRGEVVIVKEKAGAQEAPRAPAKPSSQGERTKTMVKQNDSEDMQFNSAEMTTSLFVIISRLIKSADHQTQIRMKQELHHAIAELRHDPEAPQAPEVSNENLAKILEIFLKRLEKNLSQ